jgi:hypothetical protein
METFAGSLWKLGRRAVAVVGLVLSVSTKAGVLATPQPWAFMQSAGGVSVGRAIHQGEVWKLPLYCDVSGLRTFTIKPTSMNSGLTWENAQVRIERQEIQLTVRTGLARGQARSSACGTANLGRIARGTYNVVYRDPGGAKHAITVVTIGD